MVCRHVHQHGAVGQASVDGDGNVDIGDCPEPADLKIVSQTHNAPSDVNVSVTGGTRVEIKGVSSLRAVPRLVHAEALRQRSLLAIADTLRKRGVTAESIHLVGVEAAWVRGSFSLQRELEQAHVLGSPGEAERFSGSYVQVSYFLTGEHRRYIHSKGAFGSVAPKGRLGAFEVAARFSHLKLRESAANLTLGLNWYLIRNFRVMFNTIHSNLPTSGRSHIYQVRFQINF